MLDVLTQVSAVTAAVKKTGAEVIRVSLEQCLVEASTKQKMDLKVKKDEFQKALCRLSIWPEGRKGEKDNEGKVNLNRRGFLRRQRRRR